MAKINLPCPRCGRIMDCAGTYVTTDPATGKTLDARFVFYCPCDGAMPIKAIPDQEKQARIFNDRALALRDWIMDEMGFVFHPESRLYVHPQTGLHVNGTVIQWGSMPGNGARVRSAIATCVRGAEEKIREALTVDGGDGGETKGD